MVAGGEKIDAPTKHVIFLRTKTTVSLHTRRQWPFPPSIGMYRLSVYERLGSTQGPPDMEICIKTNFLPRRSYTSRYGDHLGGPRLASQSTFTSLHLVMQIPYPVVWLLGEASCFDVGR